MISSSNPPSIDQQLPLLRKIVSMKSSASENSRGHSSEAGLLYLLVRFFFFFECGITENKS